MYGHIECDVGYSKKFELLSQIRHARGVYRKVIRRRCYFVSAWQEYAGDDLSGNVVCDVIGQTSCRVRRKTGRDWMSTVI